MTSFFDDETTVTTRKSSGGAGEVLEQWGARAWYGGALAIFSLAVAIFGWWFPVIPENLAQILTAVAVAGVLILMNPKSDALRWVIFSVAVVLAVITIFVGAPATMGATWVVVTLALIIALSTLLIRPVNNALDNA